MVNVYCYGNGTVMGSGFQNLLKHFKIINKNDMMNESISPSYEDCIMLWFPFLVLDSSYKTIFACIFLFSMAFFAQYLGDCQDRLCSTNEKRKKFLNFYISPRIYGCCFHGIRMTMVYLLMLAIMTYKIHLFLSILAGFAFGCYIYGDNINTVSDFADPCCS